jgi:hypothetical protein
LQHEIYCIEEEIDFDSAIFKLNRGDFVISSKLNGKPTQSNADQSEPLLHILANDLGGNGPSNVTYFVFSICRRFHHVRNSPCQSKARTASGATREACQNGAKGQK